MQELKSRMVAPGDRLPVDIGVNISAPTVSKEALFAMLASNQRFKGEIYTYDVPTAFLHAPLLEEVNVRVPKKLVDRLVK